MSNTTDTPHVPRCEECGARTTELLAHTHRADYYRCKYCGHVWAEDRPAIANQSASQA